MKKKAPADRVVALAGNPNVGKSTVFNALTGMNQHTGNWPGKTVATAQGVHRFKGADYILVDLPGTYSLMAHSAEEEVARDFLLSGRADAAVVVCDATCLERNLNLALQVMEITPKVVICVNLMDEAKKRGIFIDLEALERELGVPVIGTSARSGTGLPELLERVEAVCRGAVVTRPRAVRYHPLIEEALSPLEQALSRESPPEISPRWMGLRILERNAALPEHLRGHPGELHAADPAVQSAAEQAFLQLEQAGISPEKLRDMVVSCLVFSAEEVAMAIQPPDSALRACAGCGGRDRKLDRILTGRRTGIPIMLALLCGVFWLTISGANVPSSLLAGILFRIQDGLTALFLRLGAPDWLHGALVLGVYRVLAWVVSVMLPPMAIFFPLFTLLEDFGYLPRVAFNLDHRFKKAKACGKQALTMWIG